MEILVGLLFALGIITVVGHAIWWMLAAIFRALSGSSPDPVKPVSFTSQCAECGASLKLNDDFCSVCGRSQKAKPDPLADLAMTARQMDRFLNLGKIDAATHASVMTAIEEERERLTRPMRSTPQPTKPVVETIAVAKPEPVFESQLAVTPQKMGGTGSEPVPPVFTPIVSTPEPVRAQPEPPKEPRRSFAEMLETFMEESSIRWGEIVGGLLIIGCSLALVISLWSQITAVPLLKFSVFVGVTAGLFGIGFYSAFRWRLPTTSLGALTISTLLVPLNFLAMTAFSQTAEPNSPIILGGEIAALALFLFLVYQAAKVILPGSSWILSAATLLPSSAMLMAKHWQHSRVAFVSLGIIPLAAYWLTTGAMLSQANEDSEDAEEHERRANRIFLALGVATFAALLPFGLLLIKSGIFSVTAHRFAAFISLLGVPAIACGLTLRTSGQLSGKTKTAATSIALLGGLSALGGLALAWPRLWPLVIGALINCAIGAVVAWRFRLKSAHAAAIGFFALAYLLVAGEKFGGLPAWSDDGGRLIASLFTRATGLAWLTLFVLFAVAAELWRRFGHKIESRIYEFAATLSVFFSLLILSLHGFGRAGDAQQLSLVYLFYAVAAFIIAWHRMWFVASWVGLSLSLLTILQTFAFKFGYQLSPYHPVRLSLLTFASLATVVSVVLRKRSFNVEKVFTRPAKRAALIISVVVAPFVLFGGWMTLDQLTIRVFWLATIWLVLSVVNYWPVLFTAFQVLLAVGVFTGVAAIFDARALPSQLAWDDTLRLQAQIIALALMNLGWIAVRRKVEATNGLEKLLSLQPSFPLSVQIAGTLLASLGLLLFADARIVFEPGILSSRVALIGSVWGWLATALAAAAWVSWRRTQSGDWNSTQRADSIGVALLAIVSLIVCSLSRMLDGWATYHALLIGVAACVWLMFSIRNFKRLKTENPASPVNWATALGVAQFALTVRGVESPSSFWWTVGSFTALSLLFGWMAIALKRRGYVYLSAPLCNVIASMLIVRYFQPSGDLSPFVAANIVVLSLVSLLWLWLDKRLMRPAIGNYPFYRQSVLLLLPAVCLLSGFHWFVLSDSGTGTTAWMNWVAIASVAALLVAHFRETNFLLSLRGLHLLGGAAILEAICLFPIKDSKLVIVTLASFSVYALFVSGVWRWLSGAAERIGIVEADAVVERLRRWILTWNSLTTAVVVFACMVAMSERALSLRLLVTTSAFALPVGFALMARDERDLRLITGCGRLGFLNAVLWSWAWLPPVDSGSGWQTINRLVIVMLLIEAVLIAYRLIVSRRMASESLWRKSLRADLPALAAIGLAALAFVLVVEFEQFASFGAVFIGWGAIVAVALTLVGVCLIGIAFAVLPGEDPFDLNERGRMRYVYAVEVFLVLTFAHLRVTMPWMFGGFFARFWPIGVMLLAFAGAGLSDVFRRQGRIVLAEPLGKTGVVLPLLPVIGFWSLNSEVPYSGLLLLVGLFYGVLSVMRNSFAFGILAAMAGNAGLWHFLNGVGGLAFYEHPQLWLIPAALSVLVAARIHRDSLSAEQMNAIRYGALVMIYVSSTADIFINGVADSPWLPIVLAVLAVGGVIGGLMLRIRAFLFLGMAFLLLSMLTMIWSASVNLQWTWLWYVTGIGFGVLIIYTVAMFERKREQMMGFVERLKEWQ